MSIESVSSRVGVKWINFRCIFELKHRMADSLTVEAEGKGEISLYFLLLLTCVDMWILAFTRERAEDSERSSLG